MKTIQTKAFTLVELIIVITILAILATIGFMSYQSYTVDARDANRVATVKQISNGLDISFTKKTIYPMPDGTVSTGSIGTVVYAYKGIIGDNISQLIKMDKVLDPLSKTEYVYGINLDKTQYQIATVLENNTVASTSTITNTSYADLGIVAKVTGNYPGYLKFSSGSETWIANIPSLLWNNSGNVSLLSSGTYFVVNKKTNLPYRVSTTSNIGTKNANTIIQELTGTSSTSLTGVNITNIKTSQDVVNNFTGALLASFGGDIAKVTSNVLSQSTLYTQSTAYNSRNLVGVYIRSLNDATYNDDGSKFFGTMTGYLNNIIGYNYFYGLNVIKTTPESSYLQLTTADFDIRASHYTLSGDRTNSIIRFYDINKTYVGKLVYTKDSNTWSTGDYSTIAFYNASNILITDIGANNFAGTSYGNGRLHASVYLNDPTKIIFKPNDYISNSHDFSVDRIFTINHTLNTVRFITLETTNMYSTYNNISGGSSILISNYGGIWNR